MFRALVAAAMALSLAAPVAADPGRGKGKGGKHGMGRGVGRGGCPPGLAKKGNGCLPPGQARKSYVIGHRLPAGVTWYEPETVVIRRYGPAPAGHRYVMVDGDLLLMELASRVIVRLID